MSALAQAILAAVGVMLAFLSLALVAVLVVALTNVFRLRAAGVAKSVHAVPPASETVSIETPPRADSSLADQAAALAVALVVSRQRAGLSGERPIPLAAMRAPMPWERADEGRAEAPAGETVTVMYVAPGSGNWKSQGRLRAMQ